MEAKGKRSDVMFAVRQGGKAKIYLLLGMILEAASQAREATPVEEYMYVPEVITHNAATFSDIDAIGHHHAVSRL